MSIARPDFRTAPLSVLLVEDSAADVLLMREAIDEADARVDLSVAADGAEALRMLRLPAGEAGASLPDLVILDLNLPRISGREVLAEMKADPALRHIPVLVLSMSRALTDIAEAYSLQASTYIPKPLEYGDFVEVVRVMMSYWDGLAALAGKMPHGDPPPSEA